MRLFLTIIIFLTPLIAQYTSTTHQQRMDKLAFMIGNWEGSAWIMLRDGKHDIPKQTETVTWQLDKTAILVEGKGVNQDGYVIHHALAIITWNEDSKQYDFRTSLANGRIMNATAKFNEKGEFQWFVNAGSREIVYTITHQDGKWLEIGEMDFNGTIRKIFGMTLNKI